MPRRHSFDWDEMRERARERWEEERDYHYIDRCECHDLWSDYCQSNEGDPICDFCERKKRTEEAMSIYQQQEIASTHARRLMQNRWYEQCDAVRFYLNSAEEAKTMAGKCDAARQLCNYLIGQTLFLRENDRFRAVAKSKAEEFVREGTPELVDAATGLLEIIGYVEMPDDPVDEDTSGVSTAEQLTVDQ